MSLIQFKQKYIIISVQIEMTEWSLDFLTFKLLLSKI